MPCPKIIVAFLLSCYAVSIIGCGSEVEGPERFDVSGNVTFNGQPVAYGSIIFTPDTSKQNSGPQGVATIRDGKYDTASKGRGVVGGLHKVIIEGLNDEVPDETEENPTPPPFPEFTTEVDLPKETSTQDFTVPAAK